MNQNRIRIEIRTTEERKKALKDLANKNNITISKLLNDLIDLVIQENTIK